MPPLVCRSMLPDETGGRPRIANDNKSLGIRTQVESSRHPDVLVEDGMVNAGRRGMSVAPRAEDLPFFLIPLRFAGRHVRGKGSPNGNNQLVCWSSGEGPFVDSKFAEHLMFLTEPEGSLSHGVISPEVRCSIAEYRNALASTQSAWRPVPWPWEAASS